MVAAPAVRADVCAMVTVLPGATIVFHRPGGFWPVVSAASPAANTCPKWVLAPTHGPVYSTWIRPPVSAVATWRLAQIAKRWLLPSFGTLHEMTAPVPLTSV